MAVKVTAWPEAEGLAEEASAVLVAAWLTTWLSAGGGAGGEVGVAAVGRSDGVVPTASAEVVKAAVPCPLSVPVPRVAGRP